MCSMSASHLNASDMAAYMINCIHQIQSTLAVYEFTDKHIEMLAAQVGNEGNLLTFVAARELRLIKLLLTILNYTIEVNSSKDCFSIDTIVLSRYSVIFRSYQEYLATLNSREIGKCVSRKLKKNAKTRKFVVVT